MPAPTSLGIYPADSVVDVAQSLAIDSLGAGAADLLAGDIEYRLHLIVQEAKKFMVHGKRATMLPEDIEHAMEVLNVEPILVPPRPLSQPSFVAIPSSTNGQPIYHIPDEEIDFATYLKQPLPAGMANSAGVKWKAHWLAVEGVQPAIPENPSSSQAGPSRIPIPATGTASLKPSAKAHLPSDLQLYFTRLTTSLIPPTNISPNLPAPPVDPNSDAHTLPESERHRLAALASLRSDAAVSGILVYLVKWVAESMSKCLSGGLGTLGCLVDAVEAILGNETIFIEPYIHQFLAPLLSIILTVPLGPHPPSSSSSSQPSSYDIRLRASEVLGKLASTFGPKYPGLQPRLMSTLTSALHSSPFPSPLGATNPPAGRYEGAILGLAALGPYAVRQTIWGTNGDGLQRIDVLAGKLYPGEKEAKRGRVGVMKAAMKALGVLMRPKPQESIPRPPSADDIADAFGPYFAAAVAKRPWAASELMRLRSEGESIDEGTERREEAMDLDTPRA